MNTKLTLPTGESVDVVCLAEGWHEHLIYLQGVRSGGIAEDSLVASAYRSMMPTYAKRLARLLNERARDRDALVMAPSKRADAEPYRVEILASSNLVDLSNRMTRRGRTNAADNGSTVDDLIEELIYEPNGEEKSYRSLVILDETLGTGKTVGAILHHLRSAGLSQECKITVATPLKVVKQKSE
jgi:hypothetical protein